MFEKLRRAKSFVQRTKREDEKDKQRELHLSETSHLRRNICINGEVLERQKKLNKSREILSEQKGRILQRQVSRSQEHLHDQVLEQIRRINFGDSYSKKDAHQKLSEAKEQSSWEFQRHHPAYVSGRNVHRKSVDTEDNVQRHRKSENHAHHRVSGDVVSNFDRNSAVYCSERTFHQTTAIPGPDNNPPAFGHNGDNFLLNRKSVDMSYNFDRRNPAYVSDRSVSRKKPDVLEKSGLRSLFHKIKGSSQKGGERDCSDASSFSECSTGSSTASFTYVDKRLQGEKGVNQHQKNHIANQNASTSGNCSNTSTASSSTSIGLDRNPIVNNLEKVSSVPNVENDIHNPSSNKAHLTRNGFMYASERNSSPSRRNVSSTTNALSNVGTIFDKNHPSEARTQNNVISNKNIIIGKSTTNQANFERNHPAYSSERWVSHQQRNANNVLSEESSRKRPHHQTKLNFDRHKPAYASDRKFHGESRKKDFDRIKQSGDLKDNR